MTLLAIGPLAGIVAMARFRSYRWRAPAPASVTPAQPRYVNHRPKGQRHHDDPTAQADRAAWPNGAPWPGQRAELRRAITTRDIELFTEITGDRNPLHYDSEAAAASRFGGIIVQGGVTPASSTRWSPSSCRDRAPCS